MPTGGGKIRTLKTTAKISTMPTKKGGTPWVAEMNELATRPNGLRR